MPEGKNCRLFPEKRKTGGSFRAESGSPLRASGRGAARFNPFAPVIESPEKSVFKYPEQTTARCKFNLKAIAIYSDYLAIPEICSR